MRVGSVVRAMKGRRRGGDLLAFLLAAFRRIEEERTQEGTRRLGLLTIVTKVEVRGDICMVEEIGGGGGELGWGGLL